MAFRLSDRARDDINGILAYSLRAYGRDAADRYNLLLITAMELIGYNRFAAGAPKAWCPFIFRVSYQPA